MFFLVVVQVSLSCESSPTFFYLTMVRFFACMDSHVRFQISFLVESFPTLFHRTHEFFLPGVLLRMLVKIQLFSVAFVTPLERTFESLDFLVSGLVISQMPSCHERFGASRDSTRKRAIGIVDFLVIDKLIYYIEALSALFLVAFVFPC